ncbi:hypothetical protein BIFDEN_01467 [Bifidobacterium dentium ATCC 27678]|nr:hypothetical protein BIFDEN_01467 [Bifidobacterium dentium ATCC 27678]
MFAPSSAGIHDIMPRARRNYGSGSEITCDPISRTGPTDSAGEWS